MQRRNWTKEEIEFLKVSYINENYSIDEICIELNRTKRSVMRKADSMYLKRPNGGRKRVENEEYEKMIKSNDLIKGKWTKEEDGFLEFAFCSYEYSIREICVALKRSERAITNRASVLKLKRPITINKYIKEEVSDKKVCCKCNKELFIDEFYKSKRNKDGRNNMCKKCKNEVNEISIAKKIKERGW